MFTCAKIRNGASYLGKHLSANDYYCKEEQVMGIWLGQGAKLLGIEGQEITPKSEVFEKLRLNEHPLTKEPLTARIKQDRIAFYDFQISAPKSVSIMAMTAGDSRLIEAHERCATKALETVLEAVAGRRDHTTTGLKTTGNLITGRFTHHASRELEAQLHSHFVCANATYDEQTQRWYALANEEMFEAVNLAGRFYQNELALAVTKLGYQITEDRDSRGIVRGFEITQAQGDRFCLTKEHLEVQSTRRKQIEVGIAEFRLKEGYLPSSAQTQVIARETRAQKSLSEISTPEVILFQRSKYTPSDLAHLDNMAKVALQSSTLASNPPIGSTHPVLEFNNELQPNAGVYEKEVIRQAMSHCLERNSVTTQKDVLAYALAENVGRVDYTRLLDEVQKAPILFERKNPLTLITSEENLRLEKRMVEIVCESRGTCEPIGFFDPVDSTQSKEVLDDAHRDKNEAEQSHPKAPPKNTTLGEDQKAAVESILHSRDMVLGLRGPAGTGKTTTLKTLDEVFRKTLIKNVKLAQLEAVYVTPRHAAKDVLIEDGFVYADTIAATLPRIEQGKLDLRGKILIVDEAGLLSSAQMVQTLEAVKKANARVLLVGDEKQLSAVDAGDALAILRKHSSLQVVELHQIRRQEDPGYREAMESMSQGRVFDGLLKLGKIGAIKESGPKYLQEAVESYQRRMADNENVLLVAPTWAEIHELNRLVREDRKNAGQLEKFSKEVSVVNSSNLTKSQRENINQYREGMAVTINEKIPGCIKGLSYSILKTDTKSGTVFLENGTSLDVKKNAAKIDLGILRKTEISAGDKIIFNRSDRKHGLSAGKLAKVEKVSAEGKLTVSFEGKKNHFEVPKGFLSYSHGYAITADKSQGKTTGHVIVAGASIDAARLYVASSRGRKTLEMHVPNKERLFEKTPNVIKNRPAALDFVTKKSAETEHKAVGEAHAQKRESHMQRLARNAHEQYEKLRRFTSKILGIKQEVPNPDLAQKAEIFREKVRQAQIFRNQTNHVRKEQSNGQSHGYGH